MNDKQRNAIIATNIKKFIKNKNITQKKLAEEIGISPSTMSDYMNLRSNPSHGVIQKIADYFNIKKSDIDTTYKEEVEPSLIEKIYNKLEPIRQKKILKCAEDELKEQEKAKKKTSSTIHDEIKQTTDNIIRIPKTKADEKFKPVKYYGAVSAGTGEFLFGVEIADTVYLPEIKLPTTPFDYALRINGDSMEPTFKHRQYIFVQSFSEGGDIRDGMLAIVLYESQVYFKKLCIEHENVRLVSLNKKYPDIHVTNPDGFKVLGKVIV